MPNHRGTIRFAAILLTVLGGIFISTGAHTAQAATTVHPVALAIPMRKVSIPLIDVGVTAAGNLDVPNNFVQAGWYKYGPLPGALGTAVIDGHVDNGGKAPTVDGVFKNLDKAQVGDLITAVMSDGSNATFKVTGGAIYDYTKFPSATVFGSTAGQSLLRIITCHGTWLPLAHTYSQRYVLTAEKVPVQPATLAAL